MKTADRIDHIAESKTIRFTTLIQEQARKGIAIIDFAVGEPEEETPEAIKEATKAALDGGKTRYSPVKGTSDLRSALSRQFKGYDESNIIISNGSKQSLYLIFQALCNPLDEVIIPSPYWVSFSEQVKLAGGVPVFVETVNHQLDCHAMESAVTSKTRAVLINNPNNPTGAVYPMATLRKIADMAVANDLYLIADEAYAHCVYDGLTLDSLFSIRDIRNRCVIVRSFSKSYSMTGFRIGYIAAPAEFANAVSVIQGHMTGNVCTFAQYGALAALSMGTGWTERKQRSLERKRDTAYRYARSLFECIKPQGAFYLFPDVSRRLKKGQTSEDFAAFLLESAGVAVVPGEAFGKANHIRISYALPEKKLIEGFERIANVL